MSVSVGVWVDKTVMSRTAATFIQDEQIDVVSEPFDEGSDDAHIREYLSMWRQFRSSGGEHLRVEFTGQNWEGSEYMVGTYLSRYVRVYAGGGASNTS